MQIDTPPLACKEKTWHALRFKAQSVQWLASIPKAQIQLLILPTAQTPLRLMLPHRTNDATLIITLPTINATANPTSSGPGEDPNTLNNVGTTYTFFVETAATAVAIKTDGTDKFVGSLLLVATDASGATTGYAPAAANDVINLDGTTTGGAAGSWITVTVLASLKYYVTGVLLGSGTVATPFANS